MGFDQVLQRHDRNVLSWRFHPVALENTTLGFGSIIGSAAVARPWISCQTLCKDCVEGARCGTLARALRSPRALWIPQARDAGCGMCAVPKGTAWIEFHAIETHLR